jgi:hypothetical protein
MGMVGSPLFKDFWKYNPAGDTWTRKADFRGAARNSAVGFSIGDKGYLGTGFKYLSVYNDFWQYDPAADTWTQKTDFGGGALYGAVGFSIGSKGYIGTGESGPNCVKTFWEFDPALASYANYFDAVQKVYIGYYRRPADPAGLVYWADQVDRADGDLTEIIEAFADSEEAKALYGTINSSNIATVVNEIYKVLFGRDAEMDDRNYWIDGFNSGQFTPATIMLNILDGAQNEDLQSINHKLAASNIFTSIIDPELDGADSRATYAGYDDATAGRIFLSSVTWDPLTVPTQDETTTYIQNNIADPDDPLYPDGGDI